MKERLSKYMVNDLCILCGFCYLSCPFDGIVDGKSKQGYPKMVIVPDLCKGCKLCIPYCPVGAIVPGTQPEEIPSTGTDS